MNQLGLAPDPDLPGPGFEPVVPAGPDVERVWREYWTPLLKASGGGLEALKGELHDCWWLVNEARLVYRHVTGGLCDDLTASAAGIIALHDARVANLLADARRDALNQHFERQRDAHVPVSSR